jgi:SulP family sulfate permease
VELPVAHWLPQYRRAWLARDAVAGITVWALIVPEAMAYAAIAGVPVQFGLYAVPLSLLGYVVFGSSRQLFVGPSATVASISAVAVGSVAVAGTAPERYVALTSALALMVGALYLVLGIARMGFVARFFAKPVLDGFIIGLGLFIAVGQLPKLVGIHKPSGDTIRVLVETVAHIGSWQWWTVGTGAVALAALFGFARYAPKVPGALVVVGASLVLVPLLGLDARGVAIVGHVPTGFHFVSWSGLGWRDLFDLLPGAAAVVVVGFAQSDANQELIGYGAANLGAGALQGYTVTGSLSKSAAAEEAGGKSPVLLLIAAAGVLLTIVALAGLFENLPEAVLAAVVIHAVSGMIDLSKLTSLRRAHVLDFWPALGALLGVVVIGILPGVLIGVALSFALLIHALDHPHVAILGRDRTGRRFQDRDRNAGFDDVPDTVIHRFEAPLIFANADIFTDSVHASVAAADAPPRTLILDFAAVADVDTTGSQALRTLRSEYDGGTALLLARVSGTVRDALRADGTLAAIGEDRVFPTIRDAVSSTDR